jgi:hypothetical protein
MRSRLPLDVGGQWHWVLESAAASIQTWLVLVGRAIGCALRVLLALPIIAAKYVCGQSWTSRRCRRANRSRPRANTTECR